MGGVDIIKERTRERAFFYFANLLNDNSFNVHSL